MGEIIRNEMYLTKIGEIAKERWEKIPIHFSNAVLNKFIMMPNHIHGIIILVGAGHAVP